MEKFFAYQKDSRTPCKYGRKCFQTNKNHTDKYKHPPTKDDIKVDTKKITRKRDSKGKVKLPDKTNGESSNSNHRNNEESPNNGDANDMEVPEQLEQSISTSNHEPISIISISNQQNSTEYAVPSARQHSQQQQQLLLVKENNTQNSNDREPDPPVQNVTDSDYLKTKISELFLVDEMPKEFYDLWSFCKRQCSTHPEDALLSVGLKLVGPYDVLAGHMNGFNTNDIEKTVLHWRYYFDPPEFQTIIASTDSEFHIGYYRDVPLASPVYVVSNDSSKNCIIQILGKSLFQALRKHLQSMDSRVANKLQKNLLAYEKRKVITVISLLLNKIEAAARY
ncbi:PREDICTED: UPF0609 protein CG1218 [Diuraphis noxia]|uniref:UPF0609 protein CG1218 n=1 Tax=Diuraphis noxia TaxID=143948 RepID=UPI000763958C|nr:PREDICTED: UPF0609 protein CG1218 [Diuraphis noxia]